MLFFMTMITSLWIHIRILCMIILCIIVHYWSLRDFSHHRLSRWGLDHSTMWTRIVKFCEMCNICKVGDRVWLPCNFKIGQFHKHILKFKFHLRINPHIWKLVIAGSFYNIHLSCSSWSSMKICIFCALVMTHIWTSFDNLRDMCTT